MRKIIIRDDDTSYFTRIDQLETIYGRVWKAGKPVCLAVVPNVYGDIRVYWREGNPYDPGVPPQYRGKSEYYSILDNSALCQFLHDKAKDGLVEICLHGFAHIFYEFISHDQSLIRQMITEGLEILHQAFPNIPIKTFVAPYDRLSPIAINEILAHGLSISTQSTNLPPLPHLPQINGHQHTHLNATQSLFVCDDYFFTHRDDPHESLMRASKHLALYKLAIITNHYWMFFHDWQMEPDPAMLHHWNLLLDQMLSDKTMDIVSFQQYDSLNHN